jgi:hypothetical protein
MQVNLRSWSLKIALFQPVERLQNPKKCHPLSPEQQLLNDGFKPKRWINPIIHNGG